MIKPRQSITFLGCSGQTYHATHDRLERYWEVAGRLRLLHQSKQVSGSWHRKKPARDSSFCRYCLCTGLGVKPLQRTAARRPHPETAVGPLLFRKRGWAGVAGFPRAYTALQVREGSLLAALLTLPTYRQVLWGHCYSVQSKHKTNPTLNATFSISCITELSSWI